MIILTVHTESDARQVADRFPLSDDELVVDLRHLSPPMRATIARQVNEQRVARVLADDLDDFSYLEIAAAHCATILSREAFLS